MAKEQHERLDAWTTTERGEKTFWTRVGSAFVNRDDSITVFLEALPVSGKVILRRPAEREDRDDRDDRRGRENDRKR